MIIDKLSNSKQYYNLGLRIEKGFKYLESADLTKLELGRHDIDGSNIFALVSEYETKESDQAFLEAHRKYIDIQYIVSGKEKMGYCPIEGLEAAVEYDENKDIIFFKGQSDLITVKEGMFALFSVEDAHMPNIIASNKEVVKKVVIKILVD